MKIIPTKSNFSNSYCIHVHNLIFSGLACIFLYIFVYLIYFVTNFSLQLISTNPFHKYRRSKASRCTTRTGSYSRLRAGWRSKAEKAMLKLRLTLVVGRFSQQSWKDFIFRKPGIYGILHLDKSGFER